jgi:MATE family multidrug resistance protein
MIPLAISNATAVKVGYTNGAKVYKSLKKYAYTGIKISVGFMACSAFFVGTFAEFLTKLFTNDIELIKICVPIVYVLCFFQVFDGLQVTLSGIFRGIKHTKIVMVSNFIGYWIIAFPLGCMLAFKFGLNLLGFWYALGFSAVVLCTIMLLSMIRKFKKLEL